MKALFIVTALGLALGAGSAYAQTNRTQPQTPKTAAPTPRSDASKTPSSAKADQAFVMEAAKGGMAEVELGKLAAEKGSSDEVKTFAKRMVDDHSKANDELKSIASSKQITLPTAMDAKDKALHDRLSKLSGSAFDRAYMTAMVKDHTTDVNAFTKESRSGKDSDIKAFAAKTLPTLKEHLTQARETDRAVLKTASAKNKPEQSRPSATKGTQSK